MSDLFFERSRSLTGAASRGGASALPRAIVLVALSQLPFLAAQFGYGIGRATINLDMLLALMIACGSRPAGMVILFVAWAGEIARDAARNFHFAQTLDFLGAIRFAGLVSLPHLIPWQMIVALVGMAACAVAIHVLIGRFGRTTSRGRIAGAVFALGCVAVAADVGNGSIYVFGLGADRTLVDLNIAGSTARNLLIDRMTDRSTGGQPMRRFDQPLTFEHIRAWRTAHPQSGALLILVESMGLPNSLPVRDWLYHRVETGQLSTRWKIMPGRETFYGPTTYGELRVLCGLRGDYAALTPADESGCLPHLFADAGGATYGLHGFNLRMFDRDRWWRELGIDPQDFSGEADLPGRTHCNDAFPGICDAVVLRRATALADVPGRFVYTVTLDTHLPLPWQVQAVRPDLLRLCQADHVPPLACRMVDRLADVLDEIAVDMSRMRTSPLVVVVGDHAPPFFQPAARASFDAAHVTMITFLPNAGLRP
jgi:hypothetical protein